MKKRGRTISIYIPDGNPRSIKICDIQDSIVKAFFIPRTKLNDIIERQELQSPGIYFLLGEKNEIGKHQIYIGEAETLIKRIKQHNTSKDFWNTAVCFISEKGNINKAHIKYLESYCYNQAKNINKCTLINSINPTPSSLTEQDIDFSMSLFDDIKILISTLGFPIFEENKKEKKNIFYCKGKGAVAKGEINEDGGITILKGSSAIIKETTTAGSWIIGMRKKLLDNDILEQEGDYYIFTEDYTLNSPSTAASAVLGRRANGWTERKNEKNKSIDEIFRK